MYVTSSILALEAGRMHISRIKTKVAMASTYYVGSFSKRAEKTVDGKRLKCDCPLRRSIYCSVSSLLLFLPEGGGGEGLEKSE